MKKTRTVFFLVNNVVSSVCACLCALCCDNREHNVRAVVASMTCSMKNMWSLNHHQPIHHSHIAYMVNSYICIIIDQNLYVLPSRNVLKSFSFHLSPCLFLFLFMNFFSLQFFFLCACMHTVNITYDCVCFFIRMCTQYTHKHHTESSINDLFLNIRILLGSIHFRSFEVLVRRL